ncbi:MAG: hypothetical protein KR126chlam3_00108 [Chlamydiae bacterium]|nr:hypothetical protein [Chlamydiota bacterium]
MATFLNFSRAQEDNLKCVDFDVNAALRKNAWCPNLDPCKAEELLYSKPVYTYLLRPNMIGRGFSISFVHPNGTIHHDNFTLIDPRYGIWHNGNGSHVGKLEKVLCDMMECTPFDLKPLK